MQFARGLLLVLILRELQRFSVELRFHVEFVELHRSEWLLLERSLYRLSERTQLRFDFAFPL